MKIFIINVLIALLFTVSVQAETYCQTVNSTGRVDIANAFTKSTNKLFKSKGIKYRTTVKEVSNTIKNHCKANPYATNDDIIKLFIDMSDVLVAAGM